MPDILSKIVEDRISDIKKTGYDFSFLLPSERKRKVHPFLKSKGLILEVKRASPSKGDIAPLLDSYETAFSYADCGASAISCLTEKNYFKGSLQDLINVCKAVDDYEKSSGKEGPAVLRKDFLISEEDVDVAYKAGADAVLLISRILTKEKMLSMAQRAASYKMTSLIEVRLDEDVEKLEYVCSKVDSSFIACGVNSRDLSDFTIDLLKPCMMLKKLQKVLGSEARVIFESGIRTQESAAFVSSLGFKGLLLGEAAAKNPSIRKGLVSSFINAEENPNADFWKKYAALLSEKNKEDPFFKICGLTNKEDAIYASEKNADFLGFIFYDKSKRHIDTAFAEEILDEVSKKSSAIKVAVIVDPDDKEARLAIELCKNKKIDLLQLHTVDCIKKFLSDSELKKLPHFCAVNISCKEDLKILDELFDSGECRVLLDAFVSDQKGGSGTMIEKNLVELALKKYPLWLAGGITFENVSEVISSYKPELIDSASGTEAFPGIKDKNKIDLFFSRKSFK